MKKNIGVMGCLPNLPLEFPVSMPENSGNMVHASAPLLMFDRAIYSKNKLFKISGEDSFRNYVNKTCSHLIITMANTLVVGKQDDEKYLRLRRSLEQYDVPIIVFGLGVQDKSMNLSEAYLCKEAINLLKFLSEKAAYVGVRGEYTKAVIEKCTNINNVYVTGCPSLFSSKEGLELLYKNIYESNTITGKPALSVTNLNRPTEVSLLSEAIKKNYFLIEPVSKIAHQYHLDLISGKKVPPPYFLKNYQKLSLDVPIIESFYIKNYRLFRDTATWYSFNKECVSISYGTRFHVNMATILSGKPGLWITHDARTRELVDFFNLPSVDLELSTKIDLRDLDEFTNYDLFFEKINYLFDNFNNYLLCNGLTEIDKLSL